MEFICRSLERWPREETRDRKVSPFKSAFDKSLRKLKDELRKLQATVVVLQTAFPETEISVSSGLPPASRNPAMPGVIVAADTKHGALKWLCDDCRHWTDNVHAIGLTLERLRLADLYGVTGKGEQYAGWKMLPGPITATSGSAQTMSMEQAARFVAALVPAVATAEQLIRDRAKWKRAYRHAAAQIHPDSVGTGRDPEAAKQWNTLQDAAKLLDSLHDRK